MTPPNPFLLLLITVEPTRRQHDRCPDAWGSHPLGPTAELFVTDARDGCVGEDQLAWVAEAVEESSRTWKVGTWMGCEVHGARCLIIDVCCHQ